MEGNFAWAVTLTDIATGWTEARATWNRGQHGVGEALRGMEAVLPFALKGIDTDNGGEFPSLMKLPRRLFRSRKPTASISPFETQISPYCPTSDFCSPPQPHQKPHQMRQLPLIHPRRQPIGHHRPA